jgi:hypothetical protein
MKNLKKRNPMGLIFKFFMPNLYNPKEKKAILLGLLSFEKGAFYPVEFTAELYLHFTKQKTLS